jgi:hypothetical protein
MAVIVTGTGRRDIASYDEATAWAAELEIVYNTSGEHGEYELESTVVDDVGDEWVRYRADCPAGLLELAEGEYWLSSRAVEGSAATEWSKAINIDVLP